MTSFYADGGYGYDDKRDEWLVWSAKNYRDEFGLEDAGTRLLDAGCGDGFWSALYSDLGFDVTGVDVSEDAIKTACVKWPGPLYVRWNLETPINLGPHDVVFCRAISPSAFPRSQRCQRIIRNLVSALRPGGTFLFSRWSDLSGESARSRHDGNPAPQPQMSEFVEMLERAGLVPFKAIASSSGEIGSGLVQVGARKP